MCGLSGKDIRSIGDKLDREARAEIRRQNLDIVKGYECLPIGDDKRSKGTSLEGALNNRFKLKTARGAYNFYRDYYGEWTVRSLKTRVEKKYRIDYNNYELAANNYSMDWSKLSRYALLLDINNGKIVLDF
jgi:hypothetical protein